MHSMEENNCINSPSSLQGPGLYLLSCERTVGSILGLDLKQNLQFGDKSNSGGEREREREGERGSSCSSSLWPLCCIGGETALLYSRLFPLPPHYTIPRYLLQCQAQTIPFYQDSGELPLSLACLRTIYRYVKTYF